MRSNKWHHGFAWGLTTGIIGGGFCLAIAFSKYSSRDSVTNGNLASKIIEQSHPVTCTSRAITKQNGKNIVTTKIDTVGYFFSKNSLD